MTNPWRADPPRWLNYIRVHRQNFKLFSQKLTMPVSPVEGS